MLPFYRSAFWLPLALAVSVAASFIIAELFYRYVEQPAQRLSMAAGRAVGRRIRRDARADTPEAQEAQDTRAETPTSPASQPVRAMAEAASVHRG